MPETAYRGSPVEDNKTVDFDSIRPRLLRDGLSFITPVNLQRTDKEQWRGASLLGYANQIRRDRH